jgi:nucleoside-diphosphate-sugar epimerase
MRYLVTGAQGFAGRFTCAEILRRDSAAIVYGTGRSAANDSAFTHAVTWRGQRLQAPLTADLRSPDPARYRYVSSDLRDGDAVEQLVAQSAPDVVVHLAAASKTASAQGRRQSIARPSRRDGTR